MQRLKFVALGDSLTVGYRSPSRDLPCLAPTPYTAFLKQKVDNFLKTKNSADDLEVEIYNKGICGDLTGDLLNRFKRDVLNLNPDYVIILGGSNDIGWNLSVTETFENLTKLYEESRKNNIEPIACTVPSIIGFDVYLKPRIELNILIRRYCKENNIQLVDLFAATSDKATSQLLKDYSNDGLHLTEKGYERMAEIIFDDAVKKILLSALK